MIEQKIDQSEVERLVKTRLSTKINMGLFSAISNIPYELSKLNQDIDSF